MYENSKVFRVRNEQGVVFLVVEFNKATVARYGSYTEPVSTGRKCYWIVPGRIKLARISETEFMNVKSGMKLYRFED